MIKHPVTSLLSNLNLTKHKAISNSESEGSSLSSQQQLINKMKTKIQKDKNYQIKKSSAQLHKVNPSISNESLQEISSMEMQSLSLKILLNFTS